MTQSAVVPTVVPSAVPQASPATAPATARPVPNGHGHVLNGLFCALDAVPGEHDLDPVMAPEAASSPELTLAEVSRRTGYALEIVRRAAMPPYHEADLPRLYWRSRRIGH